MNTTIGDGKKKKELDIPRSIYKVWVYRFM